MWDFPGDAHVTITYELDRDLLVIRRKVYGILDFLGDIGGLAGALKALFAALVIVFQYKATVNYVGNFLYLIKDGDEKEDPKVNLVGDSTNRNESNLKRIPIGFFASVKLSLQRLLPCCCKCCFNRRDRLSHAADEAVKEELKIVRWV